MDTRTIETYNALANEYDAKTKEFWETFPRTFLDQFARLIPKGHVLDVGSGPGRDGLLLEEMGLTVTCLDASKNMVSLCRSRGLDAIEGDFSAIPFPDETFDGAWAYTSLLHIPRNEIGQALKEIFRILKEEGIFGLGMIEGETEEYRENMGEGQSRLFTYYTQTEI